MVIGSLYSKSDKFFVKISLPFSPINLRKLPSVKTPLMLPSDLVTVTAPSILTLLKN